jgi:hypothetical protein
LALLGELFEHLANRLVAMEFRLASAKRLTAAKRTSPLTSR